MSNEIGWGKPYDETSGYGMAAVNGALDGYGTIVINSYSGETDISSIDEDNRTTSTIIIGDPNLYLDGGIMYLFFEFAEGVTFQSISLELYLNDEFFVDKGLTSDGISLIDATPATGTYFAYLTINIDTETSYTFVSNTLIV